ncbi:LacI family DNA-binding transcriptional regulator [Nonomuraea sp. NPDC050783]|uniref:LacI family DNA-binding transcriptional regulator n=1 Tax=Nonomuraea sp. NPDC050783 TaxID=3154634 RepID=UPI0034677D6A
MAPPPRHRRATRADIARHAGVSQATVSLVLSGGAISDQIAESTRQTVLVGRHLLPAVHPAAGEHGVLR